MLSIEKEKQTELKYIKGVGETREKVLHALGIHTIEDLIFYFPYKYYDRSTVLPISNAYSMAIQNYNEEVTFVGRIKSVRKVQTSRRQFLEILFSDQTGTIKIIFFEGINYFQKIFYQGLIVAFSGKIQIGMDNIPVLIHPTFDLIKDEIDSDFQNTGRIVPR